jgi:hypothetical protein
MVLALARPLVRPVDFLVVRLAVADFFAVPVFVAVLFLAAPVLGAVGFLAGVFPVGVMVVDLSMLLC